MKNYQDRRSWPLSPPCLSKVYRFFWSNTSGWILWMQEFRNFNVEHILLKSCESHCWHSFQFNSMFFQTTEIGQDWNPPWPLSREVGFLGNLHFFKYPRVLPLMWNFLGQYSLEFNRQKLALKTRLYFAGPLSVRPCFTPNAVSSHLPSFVLDSHGKNRFLRLNYLRISRAIDFWNLLALQNTSVEYCMNLSRDHNFQMSSSIKELRYGILLFLQTCKVLKVICFIFEHGYAHLAWKTVTLHSRCLHARNVPATNASGSLLWAWILCCFKEKMPPQTDIIYKKQFWIFRHFWPRFISFPLLHNKRRATICGHLSTYVCNCMNTWWVPHDKRTRPHTKNTRWLQRYFVYEAVRIFRAKQKKQLFDINRTRKKLSSATVQHAKLLLLKRSEHRTQISKGATSPSIWFHRCWGIAALTLRGLLVQSSHDKVHRVRFLNGLPRERAGSIVHKTHYLVFGMQSCIHGRLNRMFFDLTEGSYGSLDGETNFWPSTKYESQCIAAKDAEIVLHEKLLPVYHVETVYRTSKTPSWYESTIRSRT